MKTPDPLCLHSSNAVRGPTTLQDALVLPIAPTSAAWRLKQGGHMHPQLRSPVSTREQRGMADRMPSNHLQLESDSVSSPLESVVSYPPALSSTPKRYTTAEQRKAEVSKGVVPHPPHQTIRRFPEGSRARWE